MTYDGQLVNSYFNPKEQSQYLESFTTGNSEELIKKYIYIF